MKRDSHILKIVNNGRTFSQDVGVKCFPRQTYGLSEDAPQEFKGQYSLIGENGYLYKFDEEEMRNPESVFSQKKYCSVVGETIDIVDDFREKYEESRNQNANVFRRRKGRLGEFMDKNGWMNKVVKIMGFQRTEKSRQASNRDRELRINSLKPKKFYENPVALKPLPKENFATLSLYTEKAKIRNKRFSLHGQKKGDLDLQRSINLRTPRQIETEEQNRYLDAESLTNKMASTLHDKEWRSTMSTIRKKYNSPTKKNESQSINSARLMNLTCDDWSKNIISKDETNEETDELKEWFNTTLNSHSNRWKYRKPKKVETNSSEQITDTRN